MNIKIKNILKKIQDSGYEAYVVGGFVRDYLLGRETYDVDIATSATPKELKEIFALNNSNEDNYGSIRIHDSLYNYDITTYRIERQYENRRPVDYEYIKDIKEDIKRRDFTINALYMDISGNIHDEVGGKRDLDAKIIRAIGSIQDRITEDPLRILRAVRFASVIDFEIEPNLLNYIRQNRQLLRTLSYTRKKEELSNIFKNNNRLKGIKLIKQLGLDKELDLKFNDDIVPVENELGIWAQMDYSVKYPFKKNEVTIITSIKKILEYGTIDNYVLYQYGLYICMIAGEILNIGMPFISETYKNMPLYTIKDLKINGDNIQEILNIPPSDTIRDILHDLELNVLNGTIPNDYAMLKQYILDNWR